MSLAIYRPPVDVLADRKCVGRQPEILYIIPSAEQPWYGTIVEGRRFTDEQDRALISAGKCPLTCEIITVRRNATDREMWWALNSYPPYFEFEAPVQCRMRDGRVRIIAPSGASKIVLNDGWVSRPGKRKRSNIG